ncbi:SMI1/KNR4 family protein [Hymenobacter ruricola]|uniref:SMI1/KNR4 family protein n=1 Tax=Hymenobacter ruricola TaxID=2791023 RepID=A0ABS0HYN0_9BACT|nr:SMI1/KNR4 family protein [Hymenobacter ruricola]MBF9219806.1 SMI1/KNR4 family protein [Hymenobacter ruricola]
MEPNPFVSTKEPATLADIQAIEQEYHFTLPEDYKAHLLVHNGGWPTRKIFLQQNEDGSQTAQKISDFKSVKHGPSKLERSLGLLHDQLHPHLVPFGSETGGDLFTLSVGPEDYGSVYYISHEAYKPPKKKERQLPRQYGKGVSLLASSFTAFMAGLVAGQAS